MDLQDGNIARVHLTKHPSFFFNIDEDWPLIVEI